MNAQSLRPVQVLAAIDGDPNLEEVYSFNFPKTRFVQHIYGDALVHNEANEVAKKSGLWPGDVEVLLAGPPCQTFSAAGKREMSHESQLVFHVCDFVQALRPKVALIENVPEFSRVQEGRLLGRVRVKLTEAGYTTDVMNFSAAAFGVPQMRMRCFILAVRKDLDWPDKAHILHQLQGSGKRVTTKHRNDDSSVQPLLIPFSPASLRTVAEAIDDLPPLESGEGTEESTLISPANSDYQLLLRDSQSRLFNHVAVRHSPELIAAMAQLKPGETPQGVPNHPLRRKDYFRSAYARLDPQRQALTMTTQTQNPGSGRFTHYRDNRVITVREVARLQSFPDRIRFFGAQAVQRRHVGNAVPPLLAQAIASVLLPLLNT